MSPAVPTGARHEFGVDELFFSTTDGRGVIDQANPTFVRLSRYSRPQLIGAPHNLIRHPVMPGGAFLLMWETLEAGEPFCAYVDNVAADGSTYSVFATITPLGDGYLSVRSRPCVDGLREAAFGLYGIARPLELQAREQGSGAHEAAEIGLTKLAELLATTPFGDYQEFIWAALPAEVQTRSALSAGVPQRPGAGGELGQMLEQVAELDRHLGEWSSRLNELQGVTERLAEAAAQLLRTVEYSEATADRINASQGQGFSADLVWLWTWAKITPDVSALVTELSGELAHLRVNCLQTRFRIALAMLHVASLGQFVAELIDNAPGSEEALPAIDDLCRALSEGIDIAVPLSRQNAELAGVAANRITDLRELLDLPQMMIREWLTRAGQSVLGSAEQVQEISEQVERTQSDVDLLLGLAEDCQRIATPLETDEVVRQIRQLNDPEPQPQFARRALL